MTMPSLAAETFACFDPSPTELLLASSTSDWPCLRIEKRRAAATVDWWDIEPSPDVTLACFSAGECYFEILAESKQHRVACRPGVGFFITLTGTQRVRWSSPVSQHVEVTHIRLPRLLFHELLDEYRRIGAKHRELASQFCSIDDPVSYAVAGSLLQALAEGAPRLYAESAARFLAVHLLSRSSMNLVSAEDQRRSGTLSDRRLARVIAYVNAHYGDPLSLEDLAREAGISRFHFVTVFQRKLGVTPHRYLTEVRLDEAARLLRCDTQAIKEIAQACGYGNNAQFAAAFRKRFACTPGAYRHQAKNRE